MKKEELKKYCFAAMNMYGIISIKRLATMVEKNSGYKVSEYEIKRNIQIDEELNEEIMIRDGEAIHRVIWKAGAYRTLKRSQRGRPWYEPENHKFLSYSYLENYVKSKELILLKNFFIKRGLNMKQAKNLAENMAMATSLGCELEYVMKMTINPHVEIAEDLEAAETLINLVINMCNHTRTVPLRGYTPIELKEEIELFGMKKQSKVAEFNVTEGLLN